MCSTIEILNILIMNIPTVLYILGRVNDMGVLSASSLSLHSLVDALGAIGRTIN